MHQRTTHQPSKIDKKHVTATVLFAINNVPDTDRFTLNKFLELMNTGGSFGPITAEQLLEIRQLMIKYVPGTCEQSLQILVDLLAVHLKLEIKTNDSVESTPLPGRSNGVARPQVKSPGDKKMGHYRNHSLYGFAKFLNLIEQSRNYSSQT